MRPETILREIEAQSEKEFLPIIGPAKGALLDEVVLKHNPKSILEVGTLVGYSAIRMGRLLPSGGSITCIEVDGRLARIARENVDRAGLASKVSILVGDAKKIIPTLRKQLDMLFLDASKEEYFTYLKLAEPLLHQGSVVVADNVIIFAEQMKNYLEYVRTSGLYRSECRVPSPGLQRDKGDGIEISIKL